MNLTFKDICGQVAVKNLYESGVMITEIARQAKVSQSTIREWLRNFPRYSGIVKIPNSFTLTSPT
jgi:transposase-like protein